MREEKITFIIRVSESYNAACRCINSIKRQTSDAYEICGIVYTEEIAEELRTAYPDIEFYVAESNKKCKNKFNSIVSQVTTKYCMFVDSDSILVNHLVETILEYDDELVVFNLSKGNRNSNFSTFYSYGDFKSIASFMDHTQSIWGVAFDPVFVKKNKIKLKGMGYEKQALFLLLCLSLSKSVSFNRNVFVYKWTIPLKRPISADFYYGNKSDVRRAMKGFSKKGDKAAKVQIIKNFLLPEIEASYNRDFLRRTKKMLSLIRLIWF